MQLYKCVTLSCSIEQILKLCTNEKFKGNIQNFRNFHTKCSKNTIIGGEQMEDRQILQMVKTSSTFEPNVLEKQEKTVKFH